MAKAVLVIAVPAGLIEALISVSTALPNSETTQGPFGLTFANGTASDHWSYTAGALLVLLISELTSTVAIATYSSCQRKKQHS